MFWKVPGFSQPSPIEQILEKEEFTLEELLDEDDIIQECKSLNGRLIAFLRERSTVEQLIRFLIEPAKDTDDPKRLYKYPFTACEIFCCEVEAIFNTMLKDTSLMHLLFSFLNGESPLNSKTAGYFGRVINHLLGAKSSEIMLFLQDTPSILVNLIQHIGTTSVADIMKRIVGADEQSSTPVATTYSQWLSESPVINLLLEKMSAINSSEIKSNAADILTSIARNQPSPLVAKLTDSEAINKLFEYALDQNNTSVLVPALDVCIALLHTTRSPPSGADAATTNTDANPSAASSPSFPGPRDSVTSHTTNAASVIAAHAPRLIQCLQAPQEGVTQLTPYGILAPPLGRARLKMVELLSVLLCAGNSATEELMIRAGSLQLCLDLFAKYPFNNLLHHSVTSMLTAVLQRQSPTLMHHLFTDCAFLDWIVSLPTEVRPPPRPGHEESRSSQIMLRAGYLGHVTRIATQLDNLCSVSCGPGINDPMQQPLLALLSQHAGWQTYLESVLRPRQELENVGRWACGRPASHDMPAVDSDQDEFQHDVELEHIAQHQQQAMFHSRYGASDDNDEDDDDEVGDLGTSAQLTMLDRGRFTAGLVGEALSHMKVSESQPVEETITEEIGREQPDASNFQEGSLGDQAMEDDEVLMATSDEEASPQEDVPPEDLSGSCDIASPGLMQKVSEDLVVIEEDIPEMVEADCKQSSGSQEFNDLAFWNTSTWNPNFPDSSTRDVSSVAL